MYVVCCLLGFSILLIFETVFTTVCFLVESALVIVECFIHASWYLHQSDKVYSSLLPMYLVPPTYAALSTSDRMFKHAADFNARRNLAISSRHRLVGKKHGAINAIHQEMT